VNDWTFFPLPPQLRFNRTSTSIPIALTMMRISEKIIAASVLSSSIGCSAISAARKGFSHLSKKENSFEIYIN